MIRIIFRWEFAILLNPSLYILAEQQNRSIRCGSSSEKDQRKIYHLTERLFGK